MYHLTRISTNRKTGPIPVTTSGEDTCPNSCGVKSACYAKGGPLAIHWRKVNQGQRGTNFAGLLKEIRRFPKGQLWRHNQAGDLPGKNENIDGPKLEALTRANKGKNGFTYTHKNPDYKTNGDKIKKANENGFTINLSCDSIGQVDKALKRNIGPVIVVLPQSYGAFKAAYTPNKSPVIICPATYRDNINCQTCGLCQKAKRKFAIGFPAHGFGKRIIDRLNQKGA